ncbi:MAG: polyphosphate kinase 1, partial [Bacteroidota bacterium]
MRDNFKADNITKPLLPQGRRYLSRDMSWLMFAQRVLDQAYDNTKTIYDQLKFLSISADNLDEFFMIRIGGLHNYVDYKQVWIDNSGLHAVPFREKLLVEIQELFQRQQNCFIQHLVPGFKRHGFEIVTDIKKLSQKQRTTLRAYFKKTLLPILTPVIASTNHGSTVLANKVLVMGVVTHYLTSMKGNKKLYFVQIPQNISRFYTIEQHDCVYFIPLETIVREYLDMLFERTEILSTTLFRIT